MGNKVYAVKSLIAYENRKITKTHNLDELASLITDKILFDDVCQKLAVDKNELITQAP